MKLLIVSATALLLASGAAVAQTPGDKSQEAPARDVTLVSGNAGKHAREADARHCLNLKDNTAIIRCAEQYRYRGVPGN